MKLNAMTDLVDNLVQKEVLEVVTDQSPGFYSRFFLTPKKNSPKFRAILDLSSLNTYIVKEKFKMDTAESIRDLLQQGDWTTSIDLSDAYHHIPIHPCHRKYLRFKFKGIIYQYKVLVMGLTTSPKVFTRTNVGVRQFLQQHGVHMHQYLDDWLIYHHNQQTVHVHTQVLLFVLYHLGWIVNMEKSDLVPKQTFQHLSYQFFLEQGKVAPTEERWEKIQTKILQFLEHPISTAQKWQSLLGLLVATEKLVPLGMLHVRPFQLGLLNQWSPLRGLQSDTLPISQTVRQALVWWTHKQNVMVGVPLRPPKPTLEIFTDASLTGFGGTLNGQEVSGKWNETEKQWHINVLELLGIWKVLKHFQNQIQGSSILVASDNTTAVAYINKQGGTRSMSLMQLTEEVLLWLDAHQITVIGRHIPGKLNVLADALSRHKQIIPTEWSIHPKIPLLLWGIWGRPHVDMFATRHNHKLPTFVSPVPDPMAYNVNAMNMDWDNMFVYAYPPTAILSQVLQKIKQHNCKVILIAPFWPKQAWFPHILNNLIDHPRRIPPWVRLLKQPRTNIYHDNPQLMNLHAWLLSNKHTEIEDFQTRLQTEWQKHKKSPLLKCMKASGESTAIGVRRGILIHSKPLV